jgi:hypothetical protein
MGLFERGKGKNEGDGKGVALFCMGAAAGSFSGWQASSNMMRKKNQRENNLRPASFILKAATICENDTTNRRGLEYRVGLFD